MNKLHRRIRGLPHSLREFDRSLCLLAELRTLGWHRSCRDGRPVTQSGKPLPWYTQPAILWLSSVISSEDRILEFGGGYSTLWYGANCLSVTTVEDDYNWATFLRHHATQNAEILTQTDRDYYDVESQIPRGPFDIVAIDGSSRNEIAAEVARLSTCIGTKRLVVMFDNSDREEYRTGLSALAGAGFSHIAFEGVVPGLGHVGRTTAFIKNPETRLLKSIEAPRPGAW